MENTLNIHEEEQILNVKKVNQLMEEAAKKPDPKYLYDRLILEGEITTIFGDTNCGKSILAVQIANEISKTMPILYADLEMTEKQFQMRYTNDKGELYRFNDNLFIANFAEDLDCYNKIFEKQLIIELEKYIIELGVMCIILDNMSMLYQGNTDKGKDIIPFIKGLKILCKSHNVTLILIDHTKKRDYSVPIDFNDLNGSKSKSNSTDNIIAICPSSQGEKLRYIKQIKVKAAEKVYTKDNVAIYEINKDDAFLELKYIANDNEYNHLPKSIKVSKEDRNIRIRELFQQGIPNTKIAEMIGQEFGKSITEGAVRSVIKKDEK